MIFLFLEIDTKIKFEWDSIYFIFNSRNIKSFNQLMLDFKSTFIIKGK